MNLSIKLLVVFAFACLPINNATAQSIPDSVTQKIDKLFSQWNNPNTPGFAIGVVRNDSLIYAKGYGMANLEYGVPISSETIFHMASVSKQFTAYSIVLLAGQGKLRLDDDIHQYLPWFPDLKEKITIRELLNHTSGIRDQWQLLAIAGTRLDDVITQDHIVKILGKQQALNFKPGEQYSYSNSGFTMLAEIVKAATGQSLRSFTDSAIFKPLGMKDTHFHDDYTEIVKNRAYSYQRKNGFTFSNSVLSYSTAGATSLFTNINDLSKWVMNFYTPVAGTQADINQLVQQGKLNNGAELNYALGIVSDTYKGFKQYSHSGGDAGFRTWLTVFPELKMGFMVFSNLADVNTYEKTYQLADLFIKDTSTTVAAADIKIDSSRAIIKDEGRAKNFTGDFISEDGAQFSFVLRNHKLYWERYGNSDLLYPGLKDSFTVAKSPEIKFVFSATNGKSVRVNQYWPDNKRLLVKYTTDSIQANKQLQLYTGVYYCPELDCKYTIIVKDHELVLTGNKYSDSKLKLAGKDHLFTEYWWMRHLKMISDNNMKIIGFEVNDGRIMHLRFNKI
ncbi:serine hydrolase domain-containing protein [Agriterribacter sp.]|uniref:serine hydrolase domain-containing protein n=1 Tax=Agriterribacter sp. TaxID=2821509 RepID=UPI002C0553AD|nr:serine hydrolase domain-containing protein [Agriterribacter sp.]HTN07745.1 serine hydrolase domain-containing protein [Agriterribacter sp.]